MLSSKYQKGLRIKMSKSEKPPKMYVEKILASLTSDYGTLCALANSMAAKSMVFIRSDALLTKTSSTKLEKLQSFQTNIPRGMHYKPSRLLKHKELKLRNTSKHTDEKTTNLICTSLKDEFANTANHMVVDDRSVPVATMYICVTKAYDEQDPTENKKDEIDEDFLAYGPSSEISFYLRIGETVVLSLNRQDSSKTSLFIPPEAKKVRLESAFTLVIGADEVVSLCGPDKMGNRELTLTTATNRKSAYLVQDNFLPLPETMVEMVVHGGKLYISFCHRLEGELKTHLIGCNKSSQKKNDKRKGTKSSLIFDDASDKGSISSDFDSDSSDDDNWVNDSVDYSEKKPKTPPVQTPPVESKTLLKRVYEGLSRKGVSTGRDDADGISAEKKHAGSRFIPTPKIGDYQHMPVPT